MKSQSKCPKCAATEIIRVPGSLWKEGSFIPMGFLHSPVPLARYVCSSCGFVEEWIDEEKGMALLKKVYADRSRPVKGD